jgi:hypothetical protein
MKQKTEEEQRMLLLFAFSIFYFLHFIFWF